MHQSLNSPKNDASSEMVAENLVVEGKLLGNNEAAVSAPTHFENKGSNGIDKNDLGDISCGLWIFKGPFLQKFATATTYVILYGLVGCIISMSCAYFNGTITTLEKRFKIPTRNMGIIATGKDISQMLFSGILCYYAGRGHRPRWISFGLLAIVAYCIICAMLHLMYGPGEDALNLVVKFDEDFNKNGTMGIMTEGRGSDLCLEDGHDECEVERATQIPQVLLFIARFVSGVGGSLYYTLGIAYMDDNTNQSKTPVLLSLSFFLDMLGPVAGYSLASICLRIYIAPFLSPFITNDDPRWLGAWWIGWDVLGVLFLASAVAYAMFPKELPRTARIRMLQESHKEQQDKPIGLEGDHLITATENEPVVEPQRSFKDMMHTFERLITNKPFMCNNLARIFYFFGYTPYLIFTAKYIEIQYRQSAAISGLATGLVPFASSAAGVLIPGFIISKYKPCARYLAAWNVVVGILTVVCIASYIFIGCPSNENSVLVNNYNNHASTATCNSNCHCDYVRYSPVCDENNKTYISPCHAGCKEQRVDASGQKIFYDCSCIPNSNITNIPTYERLLKLDLQVAKIFDYDINPRNSRIWDASLNVHTTLPTTSQNADVLALQGGHAISGACPANCVPQLVNFLAVMCCCTFLASTSRAINVLIAMRAVLKQDKTVAMGFGMMLMCLFTFIPSSIFFGWILDSMCLVWAKTCTNKGNCWLYDSESLRYNLNGIASLFIIIGTIFDCGVWYYVEDLKIFDEEVKEVEMDIVQHSVEGHSGIKANAV